MIEQVVIVVFGITAVWLSQDVRRDRRRFACIAGLCAQPAWIYATWKAQQWGICLLALVYTAGWCRGVWNYWIRPWRLSRSDLAPIEFSARGNDFALGLFIAVALSLVLWALGLLIAFHSVDWIKGGM